MKSPPARWFLKAGTTATMLVIFDIDGTLTQSAEVDTQLWVQAVGELFGFKNVNTDWSTYRYVTDSGILNEQFETQLGRLPAADETQRMIARFAELWANQEIQETPGARQFWRRLQADGHQVAVASGGWRSVALHKLETAGFPTQGMMGAFSDDAISREGIIRIARERSGTSGPAMYVGDGVWDARAARNEGIPFVGVAREGAQKELLIREGAVTVIPDFTKPDKLLETILVGQS